MTAEQVNDFATYLALTGAIPSALAFFTFVLGRPRLWWRSLLGWVLALLLGSIMLVFTLALGRRLAGEYPGYQWTAIIVYALLTVALWLVWVVIIRERRRGRALGFIPIENPPAPDTKGTRMSHLNAVPAGNGTLTALDPTDESKTITVDAETGEPTAKPTGKVLAGAITAGTLVVVTACITAITPDLLGFLGPWQGVGMAGVVALGGFLGSYLKRP